MADNEFIKALEDYIKENEFEYFHSNMMSEYSLIKKSLNLINRQQAENDDLFYKLTGVMHSVDKWLDDDELKQDEVNRAATMREKTLQIVEKQQAEIDELRHEREVLIEDIHHSADKINEQLEEIERLKYNLKSVLDERADHTDAIKEFAERLKLSFFNNGYESPDVDFDYFIDNLVKEYEEGR